MKLWDVATGKLTRTFPCKRRVYGVAISPDHHSALVGDYEGTLTLWNLGTGMPIRTLTGHGDLIMDVAFMPDGRTAVSAGRDWTVRLWDMESGIEVRSFAEHRHRVNDVAISKDGRWLLSASADGTVKVWDFLCPWHYREYESLLRKAQRTLASSPNDPSALAAFGRWYAFRHVDNWAINFLERARHTGADVSNLTLARCYWRAGKLAEAHSEFQQALERKEAPDSYLELCMDALERQQIKPLLQDDTYVHRYCWQAHGEKSLDTTAKGNSRISSTRQMVAWWKFDEVEDQISLDSSGNKFHGKLVGDARIVSDPERGNVLSLDGDGDYVDCGNAFAFDFLHDITVSAWIKVNAFNKGHQTAVSKGDTAWRLQRDQVNDHMQFACTGMKLPDSSAFDAKWGSLPGKKIVDDRMWHHVAGVFDGEKIYVYVDGVLDNSKDASGLINTNNFPVLIGENREKPGRYWNGLIDDVRIYSDALSEAEVKELHVGRGPGPNERPE
jgi:hypothetical protein